MRGQTPLQEPPTGIHSRPHFRIRTTYGHGRHHAKERRKPRHRKENRPSVPGGTPPACAGYGGSPAHERLRPPARRVGGP
ncbi:hypothetical protein [Kibdelosporangium philippinense]|uniref:hypothetical protein n=1 Tax=Kibdelosporangium philippinense TaxID=211113 RepID=UPI0036069CB7